MKETMCRRLRQTGNLHHTALATALLGAATLISSPLALDDDVDVEIEADRDRPGMLPGEPLDDPDTKIHVETPDADADPGAQLDADDDPDIDMTWAAPLAVAQRNLALDSGGGSRPQHQERTIRLWPSRVASCFAR